MSDLPETMRAVVVDGRGGPERLMLEPRPVPYAHEGEIIIKVAASGVNRPDILQRMGLYPAPKGAPDILGLEVAGTVASLGRSVTRWSVGDPVCALLSGGGHADYAVVDASNALPVPEGLSMVEAASLPETFFTVWSNVIDRAGLRAGERFLVHGGTSGIGVTAIQIAKLQGAEVFATAGSDEKCARMRELGADHVINYQREDYVEIIKTITQGAGIDVILDMVGGDYIERNWRAAAVEGRIVQIAFLNGARVDADFTRLMLKRLTHTGSTLRARDVRFKAGIAQALEASVWPHLASGAIKPVIDSTFPLADVAKAHQRMETSHHVGKIVLTHESQT